MNDKPKNDRPPHPENVQQPPGRPWAPHWEKIPAMLHEIDRHGRLVGVSDLWLRKLGYDRDEVLGKDVTEFFTEESRRFALDVVLPEFRRTGECLDVPYRMAAKDGRILDVLISAHSERDPEGLVLGSIAVVKDVTERRAVEGELRSRERQLQTIIQTALDGFLIMDVDGRILHANEAYCRMTGYSEQELSAMRITDLAPARTEREVAEHIRLVENLGGDSFESRHRRKDGTHFDVGISVRHYPFEGGVVAGFFRDITERKLRDRQLAEKAKELSEMNAALKVLLAQREADRLVFQDQVQTNIRQLVLPYVRKMRGESGKSPLTGYLNIVKRNLEEITSPFVRTLATEHAKLTLLEIRVADLIRAGLTSKEIAETLSISVRTAESHRAGIRRKLGLLGKKTNLTSYLAALASSNPGEG
jgi:PAS domain S-box-containing protein